MPVHLIGARIRNLRERRNLSQGQLAYKASTTVTQISRLENNERPGAQAVIIARIADALDTTVDYLMGLTDDYKQPEDMLDLNATDAELRYIVDQLLEIWLRLKKTDPEALRRLTNIAVMQAEAFEAAVNASHRAAEEAEHPLPEHEDRT